MVYALVKKIRAERLPVRISVIGYTDRHAGPYRSRDGVLEVCGRYDNARVGELLAEKQAALVWIASVWPETYSYTTSEAMAAGYPVLCFAFGAPAERVRRTGAGWLLSEVSVDAAAEQLLYLSQHREDICRRASFLER